MSSKHDIKVAQVKEQIQIIDYAEKLGFTVKHISDDTYTLAEHESVRITRSKNLYSRHSNQGKGGSIIDFVMEFTNYSDYPSAIKHLTEQLPNYSYEAKPLFNKDKTRDINEEIEDRGRVQLNEREEGMYKRAWAYLIYQRYIDKDIVSQAIKRKEIYQDKKGNVCFCGKDYDGEIKYGHARTTASEITYRGDMKGSDKAVSFSINLACPVDKPPTKLFVC